MSLLVLVAPTFQQQKQKHCKYLNYLLKSLAVEPGIGLRLPVLCFICHKNHSIVNTCSNTCNFPVE